MQKSINFFHNDNKILSAFDNIFFVKSDDEWQKVENVNVFKGTSNPKNTKGEVGDYYIKYDEVGNYLPYSEKFDVEGWSNLNNNFIKSGIYFPYSESSKMIPTMVNSEHSISYSWSNEIIIEPNDWCFSIYVKPNEISNFELIMSNGDESFGIKMIVTMYLNSRKKYIRNVEFKEFGTPPEDELVYDDNSYGIIDEDEYFRAYISCRFNTSEAIRIKFKLLNLKNGELTDKFKNNNDTNGIFINSAQLSKSKMPVEYVLSNGYPYFYLKFNSVYKKNEDNIWEIVSDSTNVWYGDKNPDNVIGQDGDLYFHNPIIKVGEFVRFGTNTLFKCWKNNNKKYYTEYEKPSVGDNVYLYNETPKIVGKVIEYAKPINSSTYIKVKVGNSTYTLYKESSEDTRFIKDVKDAGVVFWNKDKGTYGYIDGNGKICNLAFNGKTLYNFDLVLQAMTYSTNLFMESWDCHYTTHQKQMQFGFNTGGHGNFLDYNNLRFYY